MLVSLFHAFWPRRSCFLVSHPASCISHPSFPHHCHSPSCLPVAPPTATQHPSLLPGPTYWRPQCGCAAGALEAPHRQAQLCPSAPGPRPAPGNLALLTAIGTPPPNSALWTKDTSTTTTAAMHCPETTRGPFSCWSCRFICNSKATYNTKITAHITTPTLPTETRLVNSTASYSPCAPSANTPPRSGTRLQPSLWMSSSSQRPG